MGSLLDRPLSMTLLLIAANVVVSLVGFYALRRDHLRAHFLFIPSRAAKGENWLGTLLSHFAHGDLGHLVLNMFALYLFGPHVERTLGPMPYLLLYGVSGLFGTLALFLLRRKNRRFAALGASGAIAGVLFASVVIAPTSSIGLLFLPFRVPAPIFAVVYLIFSSISMGGKDGVAHEAHLGGAIAGFVVAGLLFERGFGPIVRAVTQLLS